MSVKLMDVSQIQGKPHWDEIKTAGYAGAVLRIRNSKGVDTSWEYNMRRLWRLWGCARSTCADRRGFWFLGQVPFRLRSLPEKEDKDCWQKPQVACRKQSLWAKTESGLQKTEPAGKDPKRPAENRACR